MSRGLVGDTIVADPNFLAAVAVGAAMTVAGATHLALPISTTHALVGGLLGAGLAAGSVNVGALAALFVAPLLLSPLVSAALAFAAQAIMGPRLRQNDCLCLVESAGASAVGGRLRSRAQALSALLWRTQKPVSALFNRICAFPSVQFSIAFTSPRPPLCVLPAA